VSSHRVYWCQHNVAIARVRGFACIQRFHVERLQAPASKVLKCGGCPLHLSAMGQRD